MNIAWGDESFGYEGEIKGGGEIKGREKGRKKERKGERQIFSVVIFSFEFFSAYLCLIWYLVRTVKEKFLFNKCTKFRTPWNRTLADNLWWMTVNLIAYSRSWKEAVKRRAKELEKVLWINFHIYFRFDLILLISVYTCLTRERVSTQYTKS